MQVHLKALGCRLNEAELEDWARGFQSRGHRITRHADQADLLVINTCAVTREAARKSRQLIRRGARNNPAAKLVISGCYSSLEPDATAELDGVDLVVPNQQKDDLVRIVSDTLDEHTMPAEATLPGETALFQQGRSRAFIKVQDGCRYRCTFCVVTVARGRERSRSIEDIVTEVQRLNGEGVKEIVLTGVHIGGYGSDRDTDLFHLIKALLEDTDIPRIRLGSLEPWDLPEGFFQLFANPRLMPHLHLPLQSGSDSVLRRMARRCQTAEFERLVNSARDCIPGFNVTTDIIAGFPGETETEWQESLSFIEKMAFSHIHIFNYSRRAGTRAAELPDQVDRRTRKQRCDTLHQLGQSLKRASLAQLVGQTQSILWEHRTERTAPGQLRLSGYTPNYHRVRATFPAHAAPLNSIQPVRLTGVNERAMLLDGDPAG